MAPELKLEGVTFRVWRGGELRSYGEAREASLRRDSSQLAARDLVAFLPRGAAGARPAGTPAGAGRADPLPVPVRVTAPFGEGVLVDRTFSASGGVTLSRGDDVARTDRARFRPSEGGGLVEGDDPIALSGPGYRLTGTGFEITPANGDVHVRGPARLETGLGPGARTAPAGGARR